MVQGTSRSVFRAACLCVWGVCVSLCVFLCLGDFSCLVWSTRGHSKLPMCHFQKDWWLVCFCLVGQLVSSCHPAGVCDPGPLSVDGSFVLASVLREATPSLRAIYCLPPHVQVYWFGVLSTRILYACEKIWGSPLLAWGWIYMRWLCMTPHAGGSKELTFPLQAWDRWGNYIALCSDTS